MNHVMLDIDGTLVESYDFDERCFIEATKEVTGIDLNSDWENYPFVTDRGILMTFIERQAPHFVLAELEKAVKTTFIRKIKDFLNKQPAQEVSGAKNFVSTLVSSDKFVVSVATGGWKETAVLKLQSAGFNTDEIFIASSNDHYSRTKIMELAKFNVDTASELPVTYYGDAAWDVKACKDLGINLVIVGDRVSHHQNIPNFLDLQNSLSFI
jgi:beta-phosphoglucomutase-like phosphatase (HAD superfamily)